MVEVGAGFNLELTGREDVFLAGSILGMGRREIARKMEDILEFAGIGTYIDAPVIGAMPLSVDAGGWVHIWKGSFTVANEPGKAMARGGCGWEGRSPGTARAPTAAAGAISMNREHPAYGRVLD